MSALVTGGSAAAGGAGAFVDDDACEQLKRSPAAVRELYRGQLASELRVPRWAAPAAGAPPPPALGCDAGDVELFAEHPSLLQPHAFGDALRELVAAAAALQAGGAAGTLGRARKGTPPPPPRLEVHLTFLPALAAGLRTAHLAAPGRVTLYVRLALPRGPLDALDELLAPALAAVLRLADRAAAATAAPGAAALPAEARRQVADDRAMLEREDKAYARSARAAPAAADGGAGGGGGGGGGAEGRARGAAASARDTEEEAERRKMRQIKRERTAMMKDPKGLGRVAAMQRGEDPNAKKQ